MKPVITSLTEAEQQLIPIIHDKWLRIGLSTNTNKELAEQAIVEVYKTVGLKKPKTIVWIDSPQFSMETARKNPTVMPTVGYQTRMYVTDQTKKNVAYKIREQIKQMEEQVTAQITTRIRYHIWGSSRTGATETYCYGNHDAGTLSFYDYFLSVMNLKCCEPLRPTIELSKHCNWWWPYKRAVILTSKPIFISRDDNNQLHNEDRLALEYPDGWGLYKWHGMTVPKQFITNPEEITIESVTRQQNQELRRVMIERYGLPRWLKDINAKTIKEDDRGKLVSTTFMAEWPREDREGAQYVLVKDSSTDREYALRVPLDVTSPSEGIARTFGLTEEQYQPTKET